MRGSGAAEHDEDEVREEFELAEAVCMVEADGRVLGAGGRSRTSSDWPAGVDVRPFDPTDATNAAAHCCSKRCAGTRTRATSLGLGVMAENRGARLCQDVGLEIEREWQFYAPAAHIG